MTAFMTEASGFADSLYGPIDPVVAAAATGKAPGGYRSNTDTGQNVTRATIDATPVAKLWDPREGVMPWLAAAVVLFIVMQTKLNR